MILTLDHIIATHKMSALHPMEISIAVNEKQLEITHRYAPKNNLDVNERLLLLQERYELLTRQTIKITTNAGYNHICIPLIPVSHDVSIKI